MATQPLLIRIQGDPSAFKSAMDEVRAAVERTGASIQTISAKTQTLGESLGRLGSTLTLGVTAPIVGMATAAVKAAVDLDALQRGLSATMKSSTAAADEMKKLRDVARLPGLGLEEAVSGSIRLQTLGVSADKARVIMREFGNALSIAGGSKADFGEAIRQLSQLAAVGKVTKENLDPIIERIPAVAAVIKDKFGPEALGDPAKVFKELGINSAQFIDIITAELGKLERSTGGPKAALENLTDTIKESAARIGDKLLPAVTAAIPKIEALVGGAADAVDTFLKLPEPIKNTAIALTALAVAAGPVASGISAITGAMRTLATFGGAAGGAAAGLFGAAVVVSIGQTMTAIDQLRDRYRALAEDQKLGASGGKSATGFGASRDSLIGMKVDVKALTDELGYFQIGQKKATVETNNFSGAQGAASAAVAEHTYRIKDHTRETLGMNLMHEKAKLLADEYEKSLKAVAQILNQYGTATIEGAYSTIALHQAMRDLFQTIEDPPEFSIPGLTDIRGIESPGGITPIPTENRPAVVNAGSPNIGTEGMMTEEQHRRITQRYKNVGDTASKALRQVSTVITDLSRGISRSIVEWKGWGEMIKGVAKNAAEAIIRTLVEGALTKLTTKLLNVGGLMGRIFGTGGGSGLDIRNIPSPGGMTPLPTGGAPAPAAAGASAGSGIMGAVNMVSGIATAISSVVGNFQMMGMNKSLDLIEKEVRYSQIHLLHLLNKANEFWPNSKNIWESLLRMEQRQMSVAGGTSMVFNFEAGSLGAGVSQSQVEAAFRTAVEKFKRQGIN